MRSRRLAAGIVTIGAASVVVGLVVSLFEAVLAGGVLVVVGWYVAATAELDAAPTQTNKRPPTPS